MLTKSNVGWRRGTSSRRQTSPPEHLAISSKSANMPASGTKMMTLPAWKMPAFVNALIAAFGLAAVVALSMPDLSGGARLALDSLLVVIWGIYVLQLLAMALAARSAAALR